jgi:HSP20 family protein
LTGLGYVLFYKPLTQGEHKTNNMGNPNTDVFVVTEGLFETPSSLFYASSNPLSGTFTTSGTTTLSNFTTAFPNITSAGNVGIGCSNPSTLLEIRPTYNDFWKFDEEFDILWKSFFDHNASFKPIKEKAVSHPCDIQETDNGLRIEIAAVGLTKEDIDIIVDSETLRIAYRKTEEDKKKEKEEYRYLHRSIRKASFDLGWKISSKYELSKLEASLELGLLTLDIPFAKENKPVKVKIK